MWIKDVNEKIIWKNSEQYQSEFENLKKLQGKVRNAAVPKLFKDLIADFQTSFQRTIEMKDLEIKLRKHFCFHGAGTLEEISSAVGVTVDEVKEALENMRSFTIHKFSDANGVVRYNSTPFSR